MNVCRICGNTSGNKTHIAREMMFGLRDKFEYLECGNCGCLQLLNPPVDLAKYYPTDYYSFQKQSGVITAIRRWLGASALGRTVIESVSPNHAMESVRRLNVQKSARILDVGCGSGKLLRDLHYQGFANANGVDPFIQQDIVYPSGPTIYKRQLAEMPGEYDVVMLHHAFEHMDKPAEVFRSIAGRLAKDGRGIIRIPVASSYGWRHYGINWVHLDAPRHLFLHTFKSMELMAEQAGLQITEVIHEAEEWSITGSESLVKDIPLSDPRFSLSSNAKRVLGWHRRRADRARAREMNERKEADMVCFYLKRRA